MSDQSVCEMVQVRSVSGVFDPRPASYDDDPPGRVS